MSILHSGPRVAVHRFVCGPLANNAYLILATGTGESVIVDTPAEPEPLIEAAQSTSLRAILITHRHGDHLAGLAQVRAAFDAPVGIGAADASALQRMGIEARVDVRHGARVTVGDALLAAISTPGHTPGSTSYHLAPGLAGDAGAVFTGDTLFPGGPGHTARPEDLQREIASIRERLLTLPPATLVWPGHGDGATIASCNREYQAFAARSHPPGLCGEVTWSAS